MSTALIDLFPLSDEDIALLEIPLFSPGDLVNTSYLWPYSTVPQSGLDGRQIPIQRGKILGGSSSVSTYTIQVRFFNSFRMSLDFLFYTRGSEDDFNRYANVTGDSGWSWNSILPYYIKVRHFADLLTVVFNNRLVGNLHSTT